MINSHLKDYDKIKFILLLLLVVSLPFYLKISNVLIGAAALLTIVRYFSSRDRALFSVDKLSVTFACLFLLDVVGLLYTEKENLQTGFFTLDKHQAMILVPLIFSDVRLEHGARQKLFSAFIAGCFVATIICIAVRMHESITVYDQFFQEWLFSHDRLSEPIRMHAVYFAMYLALCVLIIISALKETYERHPILKKTLLGLLLLYLFAFIVALGTRTTIVALILIILVDLVVYARRQRSLAVYLLAALIPLTAAAFIWINPVVKIRFMDMLKTDYVNSNYGSYFARTHIWMPGLDAIRDNLLFGVGTGDHQTELDKRYIEYNYTEGVRLQFNMHSQYLQTALNFGMIGVILLLSLFYLQIREALVKGDILYLTFISLFMMACITEAMLVVNKGTVFFIVFSFIFFKSAMRREESQSFKHLPSGI